MLFIGFVANMSVAEVYLQTSGSGDDSTFSDHQTREPARLGLVSPLSEKIMVW
jgi:hypothetical protein